MTYRENVQAICDKLEFANPIQEQDLIIDSISFKVGDQWTKITGTDMNRAGRLYFQSLFWDERKQGRTFQHKWVDGILYLDARSHFDDLWEDAEAKGRAMICALKRSTAVRIHWK